MLGRRKKKQKQKSENESVDRNSDDFLSTFFIKGKGLKGMLSYIVNMSANLEGRKMKKAAKLASLEAMPKTNSAFKNRQITLVKDYYEQNKITSLRTARKLIQLVQENKMNAFGDILDKIEAKASDRAESKINSAVLDTKETKRTVIKLKS